MRYKKSYARVDEYIADQPAETRAALALLKALILEAAPDAELLFNYDIPAFALIPGGKRDAQIMIAGYARHVGFYPAPETIEAFAAELAPYKQGKGSVQFPNGKPLPKDLIVRMVKWRRERVRR